MASTLQLSNDGRGWIMTGLSGIACVFGASFICVDIIVRQFPGKRNFRIQNSDKFLSVSLSLSFGVMLFSALYSMLPSAKTSLESGGFSPKEAAWILVGCFVAGVIGIQVLSRFMHHFVPHNVVDCEHTHGDVEAQSEGIDAQKHGHSDDHNHDDKAHDHDASPPAPKNHLASRTQIATPNCTPDLRIHQPESSHHSHHGVAHNSVATVDGQPNNHPFPRETSHKRPTLHSQITGTLSKLTSKPEPSCDCDGPCYGYSDLCQAACFKNVNGRGGLKAPKQISGLKRPLAVKSATATESTPLLHDAAEVSLHRPQTRGAIEHTESHHSDSDAEQGPSDHSSATYVPADGLCELQKSTSHGTTHSSTHPQDDNEDQPGDQHHHHHVPTNAFLSIGLQTSIAIALHKLPEGFITYATNHANPKLGFSVFLALFIHNITEGFAMALPLYLAINNRLKAMLISFVLGGLSQPLGAAVAAVWFKLAGKSGWAPNEAGYGAMFAVTAGIMASVALQLFAESLELTHSKHRCLIGAFAGMFILGISSALTA